MKYSLSNILKVQTLIERVQCFVGRATFLQNLELILILIYIEIFSSWDVAIRCLLRIHDWYNTFFLFSKRCKFLSAIQFSNLEYFQQFKTEYSGLRDSCMSYHRFHLTCVLQLGCTFRNASNYRPTIYVENIFSICICLPIGAGIA
jgi:hypothetical protein